MMARAFQKALQTAAQRALALRRDRQAVTAIEYALIAALVSITIVVATTSIGTKLSSIFNQVSAGL